MKNFSKKNGVTLVEIIIVIAIIGIIAAIALPQFSSMKNIQALKNAGEDIISSFNKAKSQTLASVDSSEYGMHFTADSITIFKGTVFSEGDPDNEIIDIISPATISDISLTGGANDFYFNRLTGIPSRTGTLTIEIVSDGNLNKTITISATGSISMN